MPTKCALTILIILFCVLRALSQFSDVAIAPWTFGGMTYSQSNITYYGQYGYNAYLDAKALYLQALIRTNDHITLNPAYLVIRMPNGLSEKQNFHTLMHGIIFKFNYRKVSFENRNILWHWLMDGKDIFFYRNRFRLFYSFKLLSLESKVYFVDEVSFSIKTKSLIRNRIGMGFLVRATSAMSFEFAVMRQHDIESRPLNLLLLMATLNLNSLQFFPD